MSLSDTKSKVERYPGISGRSHSSLPEFSKNPIDTAYDKVSDRSLNDRWLLIPALASRLRIVSLYTTGCLEGGKWCPTDSSDVFGEDETALMIARSSHAFIFLGCLDLPRR
ncbi:hypothetical protein TNCV_704331 [Trichonephila clavipes]|nr:hypothetical protein TNCV_704331 [Trichonephila clavipes]